MPPKAEHHGEKPHRFHDCHTDAKRWRRLDEILLLDALEDAENRKHLATISRKLDRILELLKKPSDSAALTELADDVDETRAGLQQSVDDNTPTGS